MQNYLFVRNGKEYSKLPFGEILYVEALKNYVRIVTRKRKYVVKITMNQVQVSLPADEFCRIHRSYIVSLNSISGFNFTRIHVEKEHLPVSKGYRKIFMAQIIRFGSKDKGKAPLASKKIAATINKFPLPQP